MKRFTTEIVSQNDYEMVTQQRFEDAIHKKYSGEVKTSPP